MLRIQQLKLPIRHTPEELKNKIIKTLRIRADMLTGFRIVRRSLDARGGELKYVYVIDAEVKKESSVLKRCPAQVTKPQRVSYRFPKPGQGRLRRRPGLALPHRDRRL